MHEDATACNTTKQASNIFRRSPLVRGTLIICLACSVHIGRPWIVSEKAPHVILNVQTGHELSNLSACKYVIMCLVLHYMLATRRNRTIQENHVYRSFCMWFVKSQVQMGTKVNELRCTDIPLQKCNDVLHVLLILVCALCRPIQAAGQNRRWVETRE
jgi:hypothetical protein